MFINKVVYEVTMGEMRKWIEKNRDVFTRAERSRR